MDVSAISKHFKNIFESGELDEKVVVSVLENTTKHGAIEGKTQTKQVKFYNLDAIISVGYRVNSQKATKFRIWATDILKDYIKKGFKIDVERMKQGENVFGKDYFRELLETVRSIRASEHRIWQQITDVFAEIIYDSADRDKEHMGLTTWKNSPSGRILQSDVVVAKNYLSEKEIRGLERNVSAYFDYIERLLEDETLLSMEDFAVSIDEFLKFNRYEILKGYGTISHNAAKQKAIVEYQEFNKHQKIVSDFDTEIRRIKGDNNGKK